MITKAELFENTLMTLTIGSTANPTITDTNGNTVVVYFIKHDLAGASAVKVEADGTGQSAGTAVELVCDLSLLTDGVGFYEVEAIGDELATNPKPLLGNAFTGVPYIVEIVKQRGI